MTTCSVLPSVPYDAVGPPNSIFLSRLNTQPTRCPVNASPLPSRTATHDSGPTWFATPWLGGTCTRETYRFVPAHRLVKILERPAGQQFAPFKRPLEGTVKLGWRLTDWADEKGHAELVVSKNTNELKTGSPERFRLEVSRLG